MIHCASRLDVNDHRSFSAFLCSLAQGSTPADTLLCRLLELSTDTGATSYHDLLRFATNIWTSFLNVHNPAIPLALNQLPCGSIQVQLLSGCRIGLSQCGGDVRLH